MKTRIYVVSDYESNDRLIRASSQAQALSYVSREAFTVRVASQDDIVSVLGTGAKVEDASEETPPPEFKEE